MSDLRLVDLSREVLAALAAEDSSTASTLLGLPMPQAFAANVDIWRFFIRLLDDHPEASGWTTAAIVLDDTTIIGNTGFKGAPDAEGMVEIGWTVQPEHRRRGFATAAVRLTLDRADAHPSVTRVRADIRPDNVASLGVAAGAGFIPDGERLHERWGRQLLFIYRADRSSADA